MISLKERARQELNSLGDDELNQLMDYVAFLKFRSQGQSPSSAVVPEWASLYAEFADEDRAMAEEGMADYSEGLAKEDAA
ncbi:MAG: hypothetical protein M3Y28_03420 [Armatimonadota bacterium]|nr:hypothetical protein [Armatimonadota bacterium]